MKCSSAYPANPDASFSMTPEEFSSMVQDIRMTETAMGKISYGAAKQEESSVVFRRSLFAVKDIKAGEEFNEENIRSIRPGYGLKPKYYKEIIGKKATRDIKRGEPLNFEMISK